MPTPGISASPLNKILTFASEVETPDSGCNRTHRMSVCGRLAGESKFHGALLRVSVESRPWLDHLSASGYPVGTCTLCVRELTRTRGDR